MARFNPVKIHFGDRARDPGDDDDGEGLPTPKMIRLKARRAAGIAEARQTLAHLPRPGESLHALCTARLDLCDVIGHLLDRFGPCRLHIATLGYNERNLRAMLSWLDQKAVSELTLIASIFFRAHKAELWEETLEEFRQRKQHAACCSSHAKVVALHFEDGQAYSIEGSANLCGNGSGREQFALISDPTLADWHRTWITALIDKHGG